jgi:hypothetical protein
MIFLIGVVTMGSDTGIEELLAMTDSKPAGYAMAKIGGSEGPVLYTKTGGILRPFESVYKGPARRPSQKKQPVMHCEPLYATLDDRAAQYEAWQRHEEKATDVIAAPDDANEYFDTSSPHFYKHRKP